MSYVTSPTTKHVYLNYIFLFEIIKTSDDYLETFKKIKIIAEQRSMGGIYSILFYRITKDGALMSSFYNFINSELSSFDNFMSVYYNNEKLVKTMECIDHDHELSHGVPIKIFEKYIQKTKFGIYSEFMYFIICL